MNLTDEEAKALAVEVSNADTLGMDGYYVRRLVVMLGKLLLQEWEQQQADEQAHLDAIADCQDS